MDLSPDEAMPRSREPHGSRSRHRRLKRSSRAHRGGGPPTSTPTSLHHHHHHRHHLHSLRASDQPGSTSSALGSALGTPLAPLTALASVISAPGTHIAASHDDTTEGAVHCFQVALYFVYNYFIFNNVNFQFYHTDMLNT